MSRILITGAGGFLGWHICREAVQAGLGVLGTYNSRVPAVVPGAEIVKADITDYAGLKQLLKSFRPASIIHAAAVASPAACAADPVYSERVNVTATANLAGIASDLNVKLLFLSTDLVFSGQNAPYTENSEPDPVCLYGEQKVRAEISVLNESESHCVCRMPLMFGSHPQHRDNALEFILSALHKRKAVKMFTDEYRSMLGALSAAEGLLFAAGNFTGLYHLGGKEKVSRYDFAVNTARIFGFDNYERYIQPALQQEVEFSVARPPDVSMDSSKAYAGGFSPRGYLDELLICRNVLNGNY